MQHDPIATAHKKPCIALMGEFSAGKSTLANLMIGAHPLPVQIVATRLPPILMSYGTAQPFRVDNDGRKHNVDLTNLIDVPLKTTRLIQIFCEEEFLKRCDLIDMPGISDPNMDASVWQRVLPKADAVVWCTHATQAWRQSEAAVWAQVPPTLKPRSILLLTRIDKIPRQHERDRLLRRVKKETEGTFDACLPISLLAAHAAGDDFCAWQESGAEEFARCLSAMMERIAVECAGGSYVAPAATAQPKPKPEETPPSEAKITPKRVTRGG